MYWLLTSKIIKAMIFLLNLKCVHGRETKIINCVNDNGYLDCGVSQNLFFCTKTDVFCLPDGDDIPCTDPEVKAVKTYFISILV